MKKYFWILFGLFLFSFNAFSQNEVMFSLSKDDNNFRYSMYYSNKMLGENTYTLSVLDWSEKTLYIAEFNSTKECIESYNMYAAVKRSWTEGQNSTDEWIIEDIINKIKEADFSTPDAKISVQDDYTWTAKLISSSILSINTYK